jgi:hypothetical protein
MDTLEHIEYLGKLARINNAFNQEEALKSFKKNLKLFLNSKSSSSESTDNLFNMKGLPPVYNVLFTDTNGKVRFSCQVQCEEYEEAFDKAVEIFKINSRYKLGTRYEVSIVKCDGAYIYYSDDE